MLIQRLYTDHLVVSLPLGEDGGFLGEFSLRKPAICKCPAWYIFLSEVNDARVGFESLMRLTRLHYENLTSTSRKYGCNVNLTVVFYLAHYIAVHQEWLFELELSLE